MDHSSTEQELPGTGSGLVPVDPVDAAAQVRMWATARLRNLVETLDPYVNGTLGEVSPRHAAVYLATVKEINRLWGASRVPVPEPVEEEAKVIERAVAVRNRVLAQLEELRTRT